MTARPSGTSERGTHWEAMLDELPDDLAGSRLLELTDPGTKGLTADALVDRGAGEIVLWDRPQELPAGGEKGFDFVLCRDALSSCPYPLALLAGLWRLTSVGGTLLLDSEIGEGAEHSQYARFVPAERSGGGWVPGRLALRWMVETSGFDVERWLAETEEAQSPSRACLRAIRADREPARSAP